MNAYLLSFLIFSVFSNIIGGLIYYKGTKHHTEWLPFEYLFTYTPWFAFLLLAKIFFGGLESLWEDPGLHAILILQSVSAGVFGGLILLPRLFIKMKTARSRMLLTSLTALGLTALYSIMRIILLSIITSNHA